MLRQLNRELTNLRVIVLLRLADKVGLYANREEVSLSVETLGDSAAWVSIERKNRGVLGYVRRVFFQLRRYARIRRRSA